MELHCLSAANPFFVLVNYNELRPGSDEKFFFAICAQRVQKRRLRAPGEDA
jgi:hypothetical protein